MYLNKIQAAYGDDVKKELKQALDLIDFLPNGVAEWNAAHGGNKDIAKKNAEKCKIAAKLLGEILAAIPNSMTYHVYGLDKDYSFDSVGKLVDELKKKGIKQTGTETGTERRAELQNQPRFDKLVGPMYDGAGRVRYDTQENYDALSR